MRLGAAPQKAGACLLPALACAMAKAAPGAAEWPAWTLGRQLAVRGTEDLSQRRLFAQSKRPREKDVGNELAVAIPEGVVCEYRYPNLLVMGPLGEKETNLEIFEHLGIRLSEDGKSLSFTSYTPETTYSFARGPKWRTQKVFQRLNQVARLVERDFRGVTAGYRKDLELRGLGFKWALQAEADGVEVLTMNIGFSHEVRYAFPPEVKCTVVAPTELYLESCDLDKLGRTAKDLTKLPRRDVYKGKGKWPRLSSSAPTSLAPALTRLSLSLSLCLVVLRPARNIREGLHAEAEGGEEEVARVLGIE